MDVYTIDVINYHECRLCPDGDARPPELNEFCLDGFGRWCINALSYLQSATLAKANETVSGFLAGNNDEQFWSYRLPAIVAPHRAGVAGESLFVHSKVCQLRL